jgi:hypothetical protein
MDVASLLTYAYLASRRSFSYTAAVSLGFTLPMVAVIKWQGRNIDIKTVNAYMVIRNLCRRLLLWIRMAEYCIGVVTKRIRWSFLTCLF